MGGISIIALFMSTATGLRSLACASRPQPLRLQRQRTATRERIVECRQPVGAEQLPLRGGGTHYPNTFAANSRESPPEPPPVPNSLVVFSHFTNRSMIPKSRCLSWSCSGRDRGLGVPMGRPPSARKITARADANGTSRPPKCAVCSDAHVV